MDIDSGGLGGVMKKNKEINKQIIEKYLNSPSCQRCGGLMVSAFYLGEEKFIGRTCVQCGEMIDLFVILNRFGFSTEENDIFNLFPFLEIAVYPN